MDLDQPTRETEAETEIEIQMDGETEMETGTVTATDRETVNSDRKMDEYTGRQNDRLADRNIYIFIDDLHNLHIFRNVHRHVPINRWQVDDDRR